MIIPCTKVVYINDLKGFGVVATAPIPKGTITWVLDELDREFTPGQLEHLQPACRDSVIGYSYRNNQGNFIFCWDNEKYINHSFHPNCCHSPYHLEIAIRDILPGEELTDDYGFLNIIEPFAVDPEGTERDTIYPDDLRRHSAQWDAELRAAYDCMLRVEQPLRGLIPTARWQELVAIGSNEKEPLSIRSCLYEG